MPSGYSTKKVQENVQAEIMQVVLEEAREHFQIDMIQELESNTQDQLEANAKRIVHWVEAWRKNNA